MAAAYYTPMRNNASKLRRLIIGLFAMMLANPVHAADCSSPAAPGINWKRCSLADQTLSGVNLAGATLSDGRFLRTDFSGANLSGADASDAKFISSKLAGANLTRANLQNADLTSADLSRANLTGADLSRATLFGTNFRHANLTGAKLDSADIENADFSGATWTDGKRLCGAGSIGICAKGMPPAPSDAS